MDPHSLRLAPVSHCVHMQHAIDFTFYQSRTPLPGPQNPNESHLGARSMVGNVPNEQWDVNEIKASPYPPLK